MISRNRINAARQGVSRFFNERSTHNPGEFRYSATGAPTLYSSCYALMALHYVSDTPVDPTVRQEWGSYINSWQDSVTGEFIGPELLCDVSNTAKHDKEHLTLHLATTVLPALAILKIAPRFKLNFAQRFLDEDYLLEWLDRRDWSDAWLEGNNLIFVLQLLIYLRDEEHQIGAQSSIDRVFSWLDSEMDPQTGLWGTNGFCSNFIAMCGGYHQLLAYYYEKKPIAHPHRLIATTLAELFK